jgi:hydrogenase maturation protein HypF
MDRLDHGGPSHACGGRLSSEDPAPSSARPGQLRRLAVRVSGAVQGVGFRPFVYRLARDLALTGFVRNDAAGIDIEIEGATTAAFLARLRAEAPVLARIEQIEVAEIPCDGAPGFAVLASMPGAVPLTRIPPDAGACAACIDELFDPANRRHLYPFIACCDCGPRFTMARALPYDRSRTAMAPFELCAHCLAEYEDPASRRFHAEPTACEACGPKYDHTAAEIYAQIASGAIVAVKGLGGFHLMCDARNQDAVARLRARKERSGKPFAVLAANLASIARFATVEPTAAAALSGPARPIVLLPMRDGALGHLAPGLDSIGVMLPASPMQWLLFHQAAGAPTHADWTTHAQDTLFVCTSANRGGEPLATDLQHAHSALAGIADMFCDHDREIIVRADDPVLRIIEGAPVYLRRGRGVTPEPIILPLDIPPVIAFGGHLKAAVCVTRGREAFLAQHVGDLDDPETLRFHQETAAHLISILAVRPERAACDLHPDFASSRAAHETGLPVRMVQHHHAHAAACAAEHGLTEPFLALTLDGYGYGPHGEAWGGELLAVDGAAMRRLGGLAPLPAPGGDRAAREPWRMAAAVMHHLGLGHKIAARFAHEPQAKALAALLASGAVKATSSAGRAFDAAAGLLGVCARQGYEAEAAMRLESLAGAAGPCARSPPLWRITQAGHLDLSETFRALLTTPPAQGARLFHTSLANGFAALAIAAARAHGLREVALSGGCLANRLLAEGLCVALRAAGLRPLLHRYAPPGDGGLALGQAFVAGLG